ncbi:FLT3-interacting zinc finger [Batrachochytrium dendrobatidis]
MFPSKPFADTNDEQSQLDSNTLSQQSSLQSQADQHEQRSHQSSQQPQIDLSFQNNASGSTYSTGIEVSRIRMPGSSCNLTNEELQQAGYTREMLTAIRALPNSTNKKPFACSLCSSSFSKILNLRNHQLAHSGVRPFACRLCTLSFTRLHDLKRHELLHKGDRPFQCSFCHRTFARQDALNRHYRAGGERGPCAGASGRYAVSPYTEVGKALAHGSFGYSRVLGTSGAAGTTAAVSHHHSSHSISSSTMGESTSSYNHQPWLGSSSVEAYHYPAKTYGASSSENTFESHGLTVDLHDQKMSHSSNSTYPMTGPTSSHISTIHYPHSPSRYNPQIKSDRTTKEINEYDKDHDVRINSTGFDTIRRGLVSDRLNPQQEQSFYSSTSYQPPSTPFTSLSVDVKSQHSPSAFYSINLPFTDTSRPVDQVQTHQQEHIYSRDQMYINPRHHRSYRNIDSDSSLSWQSPALYGQPHLNLRQSHINPTRDDRGHAHGSHVLHINTGQSPSHAETTDRILQYVSLPQSSHFIHPSSTLKDKSPKPSSTSAQTAVHLGLLSRQSTHISSMPVHLQLSNRLESSTPSTALVSTIGDRAVVSANSEETTVPFTLNYAANHTPSDLESDNTIENSSWILHDQMQGIRPEGFMSAQDRQQTSLSEYSTTSASHRESFALTTLPRILDAHVYPHETDQLISHRRFSHPAASHSEHHLPMRSQYHVPFQQPLNPSITNAQLLQDISLTRLQVAQLISTNHILTNRLVTMEQDYNSKLMSMMLRIQNLEQLHNERRRRVSSTGRDYNYNDILTQGLGSSPHILQTESGATYDDNAAQFHYTPASELGDMNDSTDMASNASA